MSEAEQKSICINLNEQVKVKLTELGEVIYYRKYHHFPKKDESGYTEFQLGSFMNFMNLCGNHIGIGQIKSIEIVFESEESNKKWRTIHPETELDL